MNVDAMFEKCEIYKINEEWDRLKELTLFSYDKIYTSDRLAKFYQNLGYYYIEQKTMI